MADYWQTVGKVAQARSRLSEPRPAPHGAPRVASPWQTAVWYLDQLDPGDAAYHTSFVRRLRGPLSIEALTRAIDAVVDRHEAFRTSFAAADGEPEPRVAAGAALVPRVIDLSGARPGDEDLEAELRAALADPFDLTNAPLARVLVVRLSPDDHVLCLTLHHIVSDGWSVRLVDRDLATAYAAAADGRPAALPPLAVQYTDWAYWRSTRADLGDQLAYWEGRLAGMPASAPLPIDIRRRDGPTSSDSRLVGGPLRDELVERIRSLATGRGTSPTAVVLAAVYTVLARHSGERDLVVGVPVENRTDQAAWDVVGLFVNTLPVRLRLEPDEPFADLVARIGADLLEDVARQEVPLAEIVRRTALAPVVGGPPLHFAADYQVGTYGASRYGDCRAAAYRIDRNVLTSELAFTVREARGASSLAVEYRTGCYSDAGARELRRQLLRCLEAGCARPATVVADLELLDHATRRRLVAASTGRAPVVPDDVNLAGRIRERARAAPEHVAVEGPAATLTHAQLDAWASGVAQLLRRRALGPGGLVPVLVDSGPELVASVVGALWAGAAFALLDPAWPDGMLASALAALAAPLVLVSPRTHDRATALGVEGADVASVRRDRGAWAAAQARPEDPVYVMFTSGTTGEPKGVVVSARGLANRLRWMDDEFGRAAAGAVLQSTPHAFDSAVWQLLWPLVNGGRTIVGLDLRSLDAESSIGAIARHRVTTLDLVPSALAEYLPAWLADRTSASSLASVRRLVLGGEAIDEDVVAAFRAAYPWIRVSNLYGPTEATIGCVHHEVTDDSPRPLPIGRPISGALAFVLDDRRRLPPPGVPGELHLAGVCLALGYLGDPDATAAAFSSVRLPGAGTVRTYRTGDRAWYTAAGDIVFAGRIDRQLALRGQRVEPAGVEAVLRADPALRSARVVPVRAGRPDAGLEAYVVAREGAGVDRAEVERFLGSRLPPEHVPTVVHVAGAPPPEATAVSQDPLERRVGEVWAEVLGQPRLGPSDDFFAAGGHSLVAARLLARVRSAFGVELGLRDLFEHRTVAAFAALVSERGGVAVARSEPLSRAPSDRALRATHQQRRIWFQERLRPGTAAHRIQLARRIVGPLDVPALTAAVRATVARHEALRTRLVECDGELWLDPRPPDEFTLAVDDLGASALPDAEARALLLDDAIRPYDLAAELPIRGRLARLGPDDHLLGLTLHHCATDGASSALIARDLGALYSRLAGRADAPPLPDLPLQYRDYAHWQQLLVESERLDAHVDFWRRLLDGAPALAALPLDRPRPARQSDAGEILTTTLRPEASAALAELARGQGATVFMALLAGFAALLARYSPQDDVVVGTPVAQRLHPELEPVVGYFANVLPFRVDVSGEPSFLELLARVRSLVIAGLAHQEAPFEQLVERLGPARHPSFDPVFQVLLSMDTTEKAPIEIPGTAVAEVHVDRGVVLADLALDVTDTPSGLACVFSYRTALFDRATIAGMARSFAALLRSAVAAPGTPVADLPLLGAREHGRLAHWGSNRGAKPERANVVERFDQVCARQEGAIAVAGSAGTLTYGELAERSRRLAATLAAVGCRRGSVVAVSVPRTPDLVVAMLAALRAEGAYVALEPAHPPARLLQIVAEAGATAAVVAPGTADALRTAGIPLVPVDGEPAAVGARAPRPAGRDDVAYLVYTSGSTGRPKGVAIRHSSLVNLVDGCAELLKAGPADVWTSCHSVAFDLSAFEIWSALLTGGRLIVVPDAERHDPRRLLRLLRDEGVTILSQTPSALSPLLEAAADPAAQASLRGLHALVCGGEALPGGLAARLVTAVIPAWNFYGPAEAAVWATAHRIEVADGERESASIGRPLRNVEVWILDKRGRPAPAGATGELCIGGAGVATGYWRQPELTERAFLTVDLPLRGPTRLYRTGDLGRFLPDGSLLFAGRRDRQVKIRGHRIEPDEVEHALRGHAAVGEAAVVARPLPSGDEGLVAFVVAPAGAADRSELARHCRRLLPSHMVPSLFVELAELPTTASAKVDHARLVAIDLPAAGSCRAARFKSAAAEEVAAIFAEVLGVEDVGSEDDFFSLGGHSILAVRLVARLRAAFGVDIELLPVFEGGSVRSIVSALRGLAGERHVEEVARVLQEIRRLSDREVADLLSR